jgi:RNA polymerase sigma-70 factor (sigma-E family)
VEVDVDAEESFLAYVRDRVAALSRIAFLLTGDRHLAEDLVQETLLRVVGRWARIAAGGDPDAYVRRALYHQHVSVWRRHRGRTVPLDQPPDRAGPDEAGAVTDSVAVRAALATLAPKQRAVIVLRYFEDLTDAQTADVLGCRVGTVKSQTRDALARLRAVAPGLLSETAELGVRG